jgi:DNA-binding NtrC family response regulator
LLGSELFGHEKGAFTGAIQTRKGLIAAAASGTIFLDEIGDLELHAQARLLRVLEDKKVRRIGANQWDDINTRFVFATNRNLEEDCQTGRFRPDLFERIRGITLEVAPLRERKADIPLLVEHFVQQYNEEKDTQLTVPADACDSLFRYDWPGNVRELKAAVTKAAIYADEKGKISSIILADATRARPAVTPRNSIEFDPLRDPWRAVHKRAQSIYIKAIVDEAGGRKDIAIKVSGLSRAHFFAFL